MTLRERTLRMTINSYQDHDPYPGLSEDADAVANAWLAEHPADSDELIDDAFLDSVGLTILDEETCSRTRALKIDSGEDYKQSGPEEWATFLVYCCGDMYVADDLERQLPFFNLKPNTKGNMRRLLACLGIPLSSERK